MSPKKTPPKFRGIQRRHDELLVRIAIHAEEMRMHKGQQWRTIYYYVLLLAALVVAFQQPVYLGRYYCYAKWLALGVVVVLAAFSGIHLLSLKYDIDLNRAAGTSMEEELNSITGVYGRLELLHKQRYDVIKAKTPVFTRWMPQTLTNRASQSTFYNVIFYALFLSIIILAAVAAFVMILFDQ